MSEGQSEKQHRHAQAVCY